MIEAIPRETNIEKDEVGGAFINLWIKAESREIAIFKAKEYVDDEDWDFLNIEDIIIAQRDSYIDEPESLKCYDEACKNGIDAIFYTWPLDEE